MQIKYIFLVLISSIIHATWNFYGKKSIDKLVYFYLVKILQVIIYFPVVFNILSKEGISYNAIPYIIAGGVIHIFYWFSLSQAYTYEDLSVVYPIARSAPALIPIVSFLIIGERISPGGIIGIVLVSIGVYLLTFEHGKFLEITKKIFSFKEKGILFSYLTLITVVMFTINDKKASYIVNPVAYVYLFETISLIGLTPFVFLMRKEKLIKKELKNNFVSILISSISIILSYSLIVYAMKFSPASYVVAIRQFGIIVGVFYGVIFLKEGYGLRRFLASLMITAGIIIIGVFG